jgi:hypothetical protein
MRHDLRSIRRVFSASVLVMAIVLCACHKKPLAAVPIPAPDPTPAPVPASTPAPASIPKPPPLPDNFELGQRFFRNRDYANAALAYEAYLRNNTSPADQDQALFRLALTHAFADSPVHDTPKALELLQQLINRFPDSPYRFQAEFLQGLEGDVEKLRADVSKRDDRIRELSQELEKLKQIDMQRRTSRPPP